MDLDAVAYVTAASDGDHKKRFDKAFQMGMLSSALEHAIPEQMFYVQESQGDGISSVKALQIANANNQRTYHITNKNKPNSLPLIHHNQLVMTEINQALGAGREVLVHTDPVSVPGWTGAGYILFDPETGSGAFKIGGGMNGGQYHIDLNAPDVATNASIMFSIVSAGLAGYADSAISDLPDMSLIRQHRLGEVFKSAARAIGLAGIALSVTAIAFDDRLALSDKIGQFFVTILGALIAHVVGGAIGAAFFPGSALAIAIAFNLFLSFFLIEFVSIYLSSINRKYRKVV